MSRKLPPLAPPAAPAGGQGRFLREFAIASAIHLLCLAVSFQAPLLSGRVDSVQQKADQTPPQSLVNMSEMVYELQPALFVQARQIKRGIFPSWSPLSQGGNPLIGKMQNAVFSPYHLPLYVLPLAWIPYLLTLITLLKTYVAFAFAYLLARSLRLDWWGGTLAGTVFVYFSLLGGQIFSWPSSGTYMPLLLLLVELYFNRQRRAAALFLPWAAALPFFGGHFESAVWSNLACAAYFLGRLFQQKMPTSEKLNHVAAFAGLMLIGAAIASIQILPAKEYVELSYNNVWHTAKWFSFWEYQTINKHLAGEDAPLLAAGIAALGGFAFLFKRCLHSSRDCWTPRELGQRAAAGVLLALAFACLTRLGLVENLDPLTYSLDKSRGLNWIIGFTLLFFAGAGWHRTKEPGLRILGYLLLAEILIILRMPLVCNALLHIPPFSHFHNTGSANRWNFQLALAVLAAAGLQSLSERPKDPWSKKWRDSLSAFSLLGVFALGYFLFWNFEPALARRMNTSVPETEGPQSAGGGIMGPERQTTFRRSWTVTGWVPAWPPPSSILAGASQNQQAASGVEAALDPPVGNRIYFHATLPLPPDSETRVFARVKQANSERTLAGATVTAQNWPAGPVTWWIFVLVVLSLPLAYLLSPWWIKLAQVLLLVSTFHVWSTAISPKDIPYRLPAIEKIKSDVKNEGAPSRLYSLQYTFLQADYPNVYELADLRTGGDNLDVLPMIYFSHLTGSLLSGGEASASFDSGLRLLGLANVKRLFDFPETRFSTPALTLDYRGPDMSVFLNKHFMPRAIFFDQYRYLPMGHWLDWGARGRFLAPLAEGVARKAIDPATTLLLNDEPSPAFRSPGANGGKRPPVAIDRYEPDAVRLSIETDRPGFVFLSDNHFPGWKATVNGAKARILRSWLTFRAVEVPAGRSTIDFVYQPLGLRIGIGLAALTSLGWLLGYRRYGRGLAPERDADPNVLACAAVARRLILSLVGPMLLFWTAWAGFVYAGGVQRMRWDEGFAVNLAACFVILTFGIIFGLDAKAARANGP